MADNVKKCLDTLESTKGKDWSKDKDREQAYKTLFKVLGIEIVPTKQCRGGQLIA